MHAIAQARPEMGLVPGLIFTLRNRNAGVNVNQQNRLHPYYLIYIGLDGQVITDQSEPKRLLDLVRTTCRGVHLPWLDLCQVFNAETQDGRDMKRYSDLLGQAIRSMIDKKEEKDIDSLFSGTRTTALVHAIAGLEDFELVAFLVVKDAAP